MSLFSAYTRLQFGSVAVGSTGSVSPVLPASSSGTRR